ncbi:MAG: DNA polymerase III subunit gamma/tau [Bdellovibrionota bacterium]
MSYQVIARKYRPQSFQDLVGQDHISQTLINALKADRFPHALLFSGTRGVGKTSSARVLAKTLICPNSQDFKPCNQCTACQDITNGSHMDVIEIDGASNNGVDSIRELRETVGYMPSSGKFKVYIIDEVHMLSTSAFNALLKTLEEPPAHVIFIMATTEAQKIPITILSRCQRFDFRRISTRLIQSHLEKICKAENVKFDQEALWTLARLADGSMRDSLSLLDQVINFTNAQVTLEKVTDVLGITDRNLLASTLKSLIDRDLSAIVQTIEKIFSSGYDPIVFCQNLLEEIRHLLFVKVSEKPTELLDLSDGEIQSLKQLSSNVSQEDVHLLFDMCLKGAQDLMRAQSPRIVLEMLLMRMAQAPRIEDIDSFVSGGQDKPITKPSGPTRVEHKPVDSKSAIAQALQATKASAVEVKKSHSTLSSSTLVSDVRVLTPDLGDSKRSDVGTPTSETSIVFNKDKSLSENWISFVERSKKIVPSVGALLEHSALSYLDGNRMVLSVPEKEKFFYEQLKDSKQALKVKDLVQKIWNLNVHLTVQTHVETEATTVSPQAVKIQQEKTSAQQTREQVENHPAIQNLQKTFKGKIHNIREL